MVLGQVSNGLEESAEKYDHGPRGEKREIKKLNFSEPDLTVG
jgi:hypothetical protein